MANGRHSIDNSGGGAVTTTTTEIESGHGLRAPCRFAVLGPLEAQDNTGQPVDLGSPKMRAVLTLLLAENRRVVSLDTLVAALWGDDPPPSATATIHVHISRLRRLLEPDRSGPSSLIVTSAPGYRIDVDPQDIDLWLLPSLVTDGGQLLEEGDYAAALDVLERAVGLWRGEPLTDLGETPYAVAERVRLCELHVLVRERRAAAWTGVGRPDEAVAELERLLADHPLRERLWLRLVESLYASGRQAEALEACRTCAHKLRDELGIDPSPALRELQQAVLRQDLALPRQRIPRPRETEPDPSRPLVGRREESSRLQSLMTGVAQGDGAILVLEGEAGIGKTRLAEAATAMAESAHWRTAWARCADDAGAPALWAWTQAMSALGESLEMPESGDADQRRFALFQEVRRRLSSAAQRSPVLLVLDDVQAADATSLQLLGLLARHLTGIRVLLIVTARTVGEELREALLECLAAMSREPRVQRLMLLGLGEGDVRELVSAQLSGDRVDDLAAQVYARTEGNPFFVVELLELLRSEHRLEASALPLPPSVRDVLERRLARLPSETVSLLQLAALAGRDVELGLLQAASALPAEVVLARLEPAVMSRALLESPVGWQWRFSHALVQETLLAGLGRLPAARLHAQLAAALEAADSGRMAEVERLAYHYFHAVPIAGAEPARRYATAAAIAARRRLAHEEAATHTRRALSLLGAGNDAERQDLLVALGDDLLRSGWLLEAQAVVAEAIAVARTLDDHDRLAEAASVWGGVTLWNWRPYGFVDKDMVALLEDLVTRAGKDDRALRARLLGAFGVELAYGGRRFEGVGYAEQAVALSREIGDPELLGRTLNNYSLAAWGSPVLVPQRMSAVDEALALADRGLPARTQFFAHLQRGPMRLHLGDREGFEADLAGAIRLAQRLSGPEVLPHVLVEQTGRAVLMGAYDEAEELAVKAFELLQQASLWGANVCWALHQFTFRRHDGNIDTALPILVDSNYGSPLLQSMAVLLAAESGDLVQARRLRRRWPSAWPEDWTTDLLGVVEGWLALAMQGDVQRWYDELLPYSGRLIVVGAATSYWGSYDGLLARLAEARGDKAGAANHLRWGIELCDRVGAAETPLLRESLARLNAGSPV
jgi:DNA-binding SARP family transcriptional activator